MLSEHEQLYKNFKLNKMNEREFIFAKIKIKGGTQTSLVTASALIIHSNVNNMFKKGISR